MTWPYRSKVIFVLACPIRRDTAFGDALCDSMLEQKR